MRRTVSTPNQQTSDCAKITIGDVPTTSYSWQSSNPNLRSGTMRTLRWYEACVFVGVFWVASCSSNDSSTTTGSGKGGGGAGDNGDGGSAAGNAGGPATGGGAGATSGGG